MNNPNANKPGYKHTPLGWIPEEWEVKRVKDFGKVVTGNTPPTSDQLNYGSDYMFIGPSDLGNDKYVYKSQKRISSKGYQVSRQLPTGTVLFTCIGSTIGKVGLAIENCTCNQQINAIICNDYGNNEFLYYELLRISPKVRLIAGEQAIPIINKSQFENFYIIAPPLPEQRRIATILSSWDEAITKTQQLITQLQQRNNGLMQQLLTGGKRLKEFSGEWRMVHIHEMAKEAVLKNKNGKDLTVLSCTKYDGLVPSLEYFGRRVFGSDTSTYKVVPQHHFAYATNHIEEGSIGYQAMFEEALISPMYTVFKTNGVVHDDYLFKLLKSHHYIHEYCRRMEGSIDRRGGLRWDEFSKITVCLPELEEQKSIASLLNKAAEEVLLHEQKLAVLQQQKKGLMQKLLTGEVRVKV